MSADRALESLTVPGGPAGPEVAALLAGEAAAPTPPRLEHLRYKPGTSVIARVVGDQGTQPWWFAAHARDQRDKTHKIAERAAESGYPLAAGELAGDAGVRILSGPIGLDKNLFKPLRRTGLVGADGRIAGTVLSYNPWRRVVLRRTGGFPGWPGDAAVVRIWAAPPASARLLAPLHAADVPVLPARTLGADGIEQPWAPGGDLDTALAAFGGLSASGLSARVGSALARLHAVDADRPEIRRARLPRVDARRALDAARDGVAAGLPGLLAEFDLAAVAVHRELTAHDRPNVLVHGDFSADQVVLDADGVPWIIDLDRMGTAPAGYDLGSFAAVEILRNRAADSAGDLLAAYRAHPQSAPVGEDEVRAWTAFHLLLRVTEPFRDLDPDCRERGRKRIDAARDQLAGARTELARPESGRRG